ncbi:MerR family transcriptional regulator [Weissella diestrammenae]|uniref:MerR family transcriptional regulator n=1 Tax=Weissella diestrammenae TaxID=1162633 RepID=A0A7G9T793_9LACO|nr:MerR family transcriptional regulator [Weissella diestrammenae]MCM0582427.1 MerR family transcriptional regulator [Weissella diestrammenae]QNN75968.1 MerR family transcriptional regulator [Weissella diestrammenae]
MKYLYRKEHLKAGFNSENYQFRIGELTSMTGVSARQLRYWESKGIIESIHRSGEQEGRVYKFKTFIKVMMIKYYLDTGYTLKSAVKNVEEKQKYLTLTRHIIFSALNGIVEVDGTVMLDLGNFDDDGQQRLLAYFDDDQQKVRYQLIDSDQMGDEDE